ncbi:MAG TPA: T9SS type A sorting domain-containing protein [Bacteroidia bacterium]|jgi:photosystem II stability/assembly factor-like uncharacterized protein|nr:T9SS type A sorting domain-containing protein [Bacteroidia bacterium]
MKTIIRLVVISLSLFLNVCVGQDWINMMQDPNVNVHDVQKAFYTWYDEYKKTRLENDNKQEDASVELFKRWEWYMVPRTFPSGDRFDPVLVATELEDYKRNHATRSVSSGANWNYAGNASVPANGGGDGRVNHVRFYPGNPNILYACTPSGGLWKSTDGGNSWATNTDQLGDLGICDIAFDPHNPNIQYIGTGDCENPGTLTPTTVGVLKSTDGGATWNATGLHYTLASSGPSYKTINQLKMEGTTLWAASTFGLWMSVDSGTTWVNKLNQNIKSVEFEPFHPSVVYAGSDYGVFYRSTNGGNTFTTITAGLPATGAGRMTVGVSPADSNVVYVVAADATYGDLHGVYRSSNRGQSFVLQTSYPNILSGSNAGNDSSGNGWYSLPLLVSPTNADTLFSGGVNIWMSGDKGVTWSLVTQWYGSGAPYVHADQHQLIFAPGSSSTIYSANDGGIFKTTDKGATWTDYSNNLEIGQLYSVGLSAVTPGLSISGWQDNGTSTSSPSWSQVYGGDGEVCFFDYTNDNNMFASWQNGNLVYSNDGGISFNSATNGITEQGPWTTLWFQDPQNPSVLYSGFMNVWMSADQGNSWSQLSTWGTSTISALAVAPSNTQFIYAGQPDSLFMTYNGGSSWININGTLPFNAASLTDIAIDPLNPLKVWVTFSGFVAADKVYYSSNGGATWSNISHGLPNLPVNTIVYHPGSPDGIYVGTDMGIYYQDSISRTWIAYNTGLPNVVIADLQISSSDNILYAATYGRGLWKSTTSFASGIAPMPSALSRVNVYPNPSGGALTFECTLPVGMYEVKITDMLGRAVYNDKINITGTYTGHLDMASYSPGVYFFILYGAGSVVQKKIVIAH